MIMIWKNHMKMEMADQLVTFFASLFGMKR